MSQTSEIEWTDATWNPVRGCVKVSPGCAHCYAETFAERFRGVPGHPYEQGFDLRLVPEKLDEPLRWKKPRRVFVNSMSDLFQDGVSDEYIDQVFAVMALAPQHTFQVLTKRAERMRDYILTLMGSVERMDDLESAAFDIAHDQMGQTAYLATLADVGQRWPLPNVWHGVSVENRKFKTRIDDLRETPSAVRFLSIEPLLEDIGVLDLRGIHLVIIGFESGAGARSGRIEWVRAILEQCRAAGVQGFVKQLGVHPMTSYYDRAAMDAIEALGGEWPDPIDWDCLRDGQPPISSVVRLHFHKKGSLPAEWPRDVRVRELPQIQERDSR